MIDRGSIGTSLGSTQYRTAGSGPAIVLFLA